MGYDVSIMRIDQRIALEEWETYIASDAEFVQTNVATAVSPSGDRIVLRGRGLAYCKSSLGTVWWFSYFNGSISVKNPDNEILVRMHKIATALSAHVRGEGDEFYDAVGNVIDVKKSTL